MLHSLTGNSEYLDIAAKMQETLVKHNKAKCGFASITHVDTGMDMLDLRVTSKYNIHTM
jgi:hypothetical protein